MLCWCSVRLPKVIRVAPGTKAFSHWIYRAISGTLELGDIAPSASVGAVLFGGRPPDAHSVKPLPKLVPP